MASKNERLQFLRLFYPNDTHTGKTRQLYQLFTAQLYEIGDSSACERRIQCFQDCRFEPAGLPLAVDRLLSMNIRDQCFAKALTQSKCHQLTVTKLIEKTLDKTESLSIRPNKTLPNIIQWKHNIPSVFSSSIFTYISYVQVFILHSMYPLYLPPSLVASPT